MMLGNIEPDIGKLLMGLKLPHLPRPGGPGMPHKPSPVLTGNKVRMPTDLETRQSDFKRCKGPYCTNDVLFGDWFCCYECEEWYELLCLDAGGLKEQ